MENLTVEHIGAADEDQLILIKTGEGEVCVIRVPVKKLLKWKSQGNWIYELGLNLVFDGHYE
jgi:hypothetical protein